ncbi:MULTISPECIES: hypothetical protein [unclassified Paenibacillus]|uniref:hypothetical protein n=1 Tax=unclassified Paenibacillus TaxID=185978 RepID=UPI0008966965|nr:MULTISPECIES: hypothetical protein [unclassified Paenibacillus]OMC68603.1 hypothetical protein BK126_12305 [Paenibacillus sp. FSL H7-0326]SDW57517.1 hypothetical protein SAMN05518848_102235 [Paenibacillus sp. PDC88]
MFVGLYTSFVSLTWWQMILWAAYALYFIVRACHIWSETRDEGMVKGYLNVFLGRERVIRLYHVVRVILDIPPSIVGLFFPMLRATLRLKIYEMKQKG